MSYEYWQTGHPDIAFTNDKPPTQSIALCDAAHVFASVSNMQQKSIDNLAKISLSFLRDICAEIHFSYLDANHNPADIGAKLYPSSMPFVRLCGRSFVPLAFFGKAGTSKSLTA